MRTCFGKGMIIEDNMPQIAQINTDLKQSLIVFWKKVSSFGFLTTKNLKPIKKIIINQCKSASNKIIQ